MGKTTIEWCDDVWNPTRGCSRVSEGCRNCFAERIAARFSKGRADKPKRQGEFQGFAIMTPSGPRWTGKVELIKSKLSEPLHWKKPRRVFVNSMSDLFHEALPGDAIARIFAVMALCPHITFQILTKRAGRMKGWLTGAAPHDTWAAVAYHAEKISKSVTPFKLPSDKIFDGRSVALGNPWDLAVWPLPNVWLGVSVENQETADERIPLLLQTPAAVRFVSYEPALGPVDFTALQPNREVEIDALNGRHGVYRPLQGTNAKLDWIIAGGESGPGARPPHPDWFRKTRDQCLAAGVPYFFKQWGAWREPGIGEEYTTQHGRAGKPPAFIVQYDGTVECFQNEKHDRPKIMIKRGNGSGGAGLKNGGFLDGLEWKQFPK